MADTVNEKQYSVNYFGNKVVRDHCPISGLKCCCERHTCKGKQYKRAPCERVKVYIQPSALSIPKVPFGGESIHKSSYIPFKPPIRDYIKKLPDGLCINKGDFEKNTTQSTSFKKWDYKPKITSTQPCTRDLLGPIRSIQDSTNYKDTFGSPSFSKRPTFRIKSNLFCIDKPFDANTIHQLSYTPPENWIPPENLRPEDYFSNNCRKSMSDTTTIHKSDYVEFKVPFAKVDTSSWNAQKPYQLPKVPMDCTSLYKQSFRPLKLQTIEETFSRCKQSKYRNTLTDDKSFDDKSIYTVDFPAKTVQPDTIDKLAATKTSIHFGNDKFYGQSEHSIVYKPWHSKPNVPKKFDCTRSNVLRRFGPMDLITTHKHDFLPKSYSRRPLEVVAKLNSFEPVTKPLDYRTTSGISYHPEKITKRPPIVKPKPVLIPSTDTFDGETLYKNSYIPWPLLTVKSINPESFTSFKIGSPFCGQTTYRNAYTTRECYVEEDCEKPCGCEYPTQCFDQ